MRVSFLTSRKRSNVHALRDAARLSTRLIGLHQEGTDLFLARAPSTARATATLLCSVHGLNLFIAAMDHLHRGRFDVAAYLYRPLRDLHGLVLDVCEDETRAEELLHSDKIFKAGLSRKLVEERLKAESPELAELMGAALRSEDKWYQALAHTGSLHFNKTTQRTPGGIREFRNDGVSDRRQAVSMSRGFIRDEVTLQMALAIAWRETSIEWLLAVRRTAAEVSEWLGVTEGS